MFEKESKHTLGQLYTTQPLEAYKDSLVKVLHCGHSPSPHASHFLLPHPDGKSMYQRHRIESSGIFSKRAVHFKRKDTKLTRYQQGRPAHACLLWSCERAKAGSQAS